MNITNYNFSCDLSPVILWQYNDAPKLKQIVSQQQSFMNKAIKTYVNEFNDNFLDIRTANSDGLSMWGSLLGVPRPTYVVDGQTVSFSDDGYKLLLRAKVASLTFNGSMAALNNIFKVLFPDANIAITDNENMTVTINIDGDLTPEQLYMISDSFINKFIPRPTGVSYITNTNVDWSTILGYEGMTETNTFDNGTFWRN